LGGAASSISKFGGLTFRQTLGGKPSYILLFDIGKHSGSRLEKHPERVLGYHTRVC
jgi:hypothetical protein